MNQKEIKGFFRYEQDSKRYHRFKIETEAGVVGTIYIPKSAEGMPKKLILEYLDIDSNVDQLGLYK